MATEKLRDMQVRNAKPRGVEFMMSDGRGLYLRVRPNGSRDWFFVYQIRRKRRKLAIGSYPDTTLEAARRAASAWRLEIAAGNDPAESREAQERDKAAQKARMESRLTVRGLAEEWARRKLASRADGGTETMRAFGKDLFPMLGDRYADEIRRSDIMRLLDSITDRGANRLANRMLADIRQMFAYAILRYDFERDPTLKIRRDDIGGREVERDRVLSDDEIGLLSAALPASGVAEPVQRAVWIMLATLVRVGELSLARWEHVDFERAQLLIPADHAKNGREHIVHLSDFALGHLRALPTLGRSSWLYPNRTNDGPIHDKAIQHRFRDRQRGKQLNKRSGACNALALPGGRWTAHDLRRTGATMMGDLGVRPDVIERCLNHIEQKKVARIYNRTELMPERREAFRLLGERLELLTRPPSAKVTVAQFGPQRTAKNRIAPERT